MRSCKICLKKCKYLKYDVPRVAVCNRCINALNNYREVAEKSYREAGEMLRRGMTRRLEGETLPDKPDWCRKAAIESLANFEYVFEQALPGWLNRLVADTTNSSKMYKIIRAERRGLLHFDFPHNRKQKNKKEGWEYPSNWEQLRKEILRLDDFACVSCKAIRVELHVHHLIYIHNFGTHRKQNLVTLCRGCHQKEHKRDFDYGEAELTEEGAVESHLANKPYQGSESVIETKTPIQYIFTFKDN